MKSIHRLFNYFLTSYSSNSKFRHSLYHYLKIFYERSSKLQNNYSSFGNVYKNSKWSNYKIENIKTSFVTSFSKLLLLSFILLVLLFNYKHELALLRELVYYLLHFIIVDFLYDYINLLISFILLLVYWFKTYLIQYYIFLISPFKKTQSKPTKSHKNFHKNRSRYMTNFDKSVYSYDFNNKASSCEYINLMSAIFKIKNSMLWTNFNLDPLLKYNLYAFNSKFILPTNLLKKQENYRYIFLPTLTKLSLRTSTQTNLNNTINLNYSKSVSNRFFNATLFESIISSSLNFLKQLRWLTRNSLISDKFVLNNNFFTEYKKLIGNSLTLSNLPNNNVWASSNLNKDFNSQKLLSGIYSQKNLSFNSIQLLNDFEQSRLWLFKKIYFSSLLRHTDTVLNQLSNSKHHYNHIKDDNYTISNLTNRSITHNLIFLDNALTSKSKLIYPNHLNLNNSNFSYNVYDYNLLTDDNLENAINSFCITNNNTNSSIFNSSLSINNKDDFTFSLRYIK